MKPLLALDALSSAAEPGSRRPVLQGLSLRIAPGEQVAVIGASGAGKTSLLLAMACALPPLAGDLVLQGVAPWRLSHRERQRLRGQVFFAPQVPPLPPRQRVVTAVLAGRLPAMGWAAALRNLWQPSASELARVQEALSALDLADKLWARVDQLSGGERQRVALARALVSSAPLWLIDEPLSALDPTRAGWVIDALQDRARREGRTLVCSLHQVDVARARFARIVALREGRCVYDGPAASLSDERLQQIYAQAEPPPSPAGEPRDASAALPATMCR